MDENRRKPRFEVSLTARLEGSSNRDIRISDLSESGCYIDTIAEATRGEAMAIKIHLPFGDWFEVQGIVAHHSPRLGFGVQFVDLTDEQLRRIRSVIQQLNPIPEERHHGLSHVAKIDINCHDVM